MGNSVIKPRPLRSPAVTRPPPMSMGVGRRPRQDHLDSFLGSAGIACLGPDWSPSYRSCRGRPSQAIDTASSSATTVSAVIDRFGCRQACRPTSRPDTRGSSSHPGSRAPLPQWLTGRTRVAAAAGHNFRHRLREAARSVGRRCPAGMRPPIGSRGFSPRPRRHDATVRTGKIVGGACAPLLNTGDGGGMVSFGAECERHFQAT